jgi:CDP-glucose 4,6-dehydratase
MKNLKLQQVQALPGPVLITGHTGFKGTWLTILLERLGVSVVGYSLEPEKNSLYSKASRNGKIRETFSDIRDYQALSKFIYESQPSAVIHMAAQPLVLESYRKPRDTFDINVMGTVNLLNSAFENACVKAVVVVTTDKVYRNDDSGKPFIETDPLAGKDPYSASKVGTEAAVSAWQQISKVSGGPRVVSARAGNVIGGGDWALERLLPDLIKSFLSGTTLSVRNPNSTRPWQHVLDPLLGYLIALEAILGESDVSAINFGPKSESLNVSRVVEIARTAWNQETNVLTDITSSNNQEAQELQLNSSYANEILGWNPVWSQEEAVIATVNWWRKVENNKVNPFTACLEDIDKIIRLNNTTDKLS